MQCLVGRDSGPFCILCLLCVSHPAFLIFATRSPPGADPGDRGPQFGVFEGIASQLEPSVSALSIPVGVSSSDFGLRSKMASRPASIKAAGLSADPSWAIIEDEVLKSRRKFPAWPPVVAGGFPR